MLMQLWIQLLLLFVVSNARCAYTAAVLDTEPSVKKSSITCAKTTTRITEENNGAADQSFTESPFITCDTNYCYAFWQQDLSNGSIVVMGQGCWESSGKPHGCERLKCVSDKKPPKAMNNTKFCCCAGDLCNANFMDGYVPGSSDYDNVWDGSGINGGGGGRSRGTTTTSKSNSGTSQSPVPAKLFPEPLFVIIFLPVCSILIAIVAISSWVWYVKQKFNKSDIEMVLPSVELPDAYALDKLKLVDIIGQGRYGSVWRGLVDDQEVAVKVFPPHYRNYFFNERDLYKIAGDCCTLVKCFGGGERIQSPANTATGAGTAAPLPPPPPPTADYLLIFTLEKGCLQDYLKENTFDLHTLYKMSLSIAKGLAFLHSDIEKPCIAHRDINTRNVLVKADLTCCICDLGLAIIPRRSDNHTLSEAGTLRYMAPEVLEGAVNLRDCESALKQIDVYALGLVLWEMGSRCVDMQTAEPQPYSSPFYIEIGENPSLEQMQAIVSKRKARPLWPRTWKDTAAARLFCETAEDCWDQDAEARLTALCVEERLAELPTIRGRVLHPMHPPASPPTTTLYNNNHLHHGLAVESSAGTVETLLSPTEENYKNSNQLVECDHTTIPLQPYHGRNPCMERNLLSSSSDCLLVDKSLKHTIVGSSDSQSLITNDFLNRQPPPPPPPRVGGALPIPYLQNAVRGSPKRYNCASVITTYNKSPKFSWTNFKRLFNSRGEHQDTKVEIMREKRVNDDLATHNTGPSGQNWMASKERPTTLPLSFSRTDNTSGVAQLLLQKTTDHLVRQHSIQQFAQVFTSASDLSQLKDPSLRVKTPGDVPPSVRRTRGRAVGQYRHSYTRFSLYNDRIMGGSTPDLEPPCTKEQERDGNDSISSF